MNIQPINDNVIVLLPEVEKEQKTNSGLVIASSQQGQVRSDKGQVVAVGDGRITANGDLIELKVKKGDQILFNKFAGTEVSVGETRYLIIKECDILAKIK